MTDDSAFRPPDDSATDDTREAAWIVRDDVADDGAPAADDEGAAAAEGAVLRFDDQGYLDEQPHWTDPPTGELPRLLSSDEGGDGLDEAWTSFAGGGPVWRDQRSAWDNEDLDDLRELSSDESRVGALVERDDAADDDWGDLASGEDARWADDPAVALSPDAATAGGAAAAAASSGAGRARVTPIRTRSNRPASGEARRPGGRPTNPSGYAAPTGGTAGRNMPVAIATGVGMAAAFLVLCKLGPGFAMIAVTGVLVGAAAELYAALRKVGYQPATLLGLASVASLALASYWRGEAAFPLVLFLSVVAALVWFLAADTEARPVPNLAVTLLGIGYLGVLGSFAALLLKFPNGVGMLISCIVGTAAYDVGGLFVGSSAGRSRLAPSISPNKTYEGLAGGMLAALLVGTVVSNQITPFGDLGDALALGVVLALVAPIGDLCESMVKRDLDVKDMSSLLPGHGGLLDRFDALLFTLPATYFLVRLLDLL